MTGVYLTIAIGSAGFLVWIIIDYLNVDARVKPKIDQAQTEIQIFTEKVEAERVSTNEIDQQVEIIKVDIGNLEEELEELSKKVEQLKRRAERRMATKVKVEE